LLVSKGGRIPLPPTGTCPLFQPDSGCIYYLPIAKLQPRLYSDCYSKENNLNLW